MFRVKSKSRITDEITEYDHPMQYEDAKEVVSYFNKIYNTMFEYWLEPILTFEQMKDYYLF
jgi:hypothetical protein